MNPSITMQPNFQSDVIENPVNVQDYNYENQYPMQQVQQQPIQQQYRQPIQQQIQQPQFQPQAVILKVELTSNGTYVHTIESNYQLKLGECQLAQ